MSQRSRARAAPVVALAAVAFALASTPPARARAAEPIAYAVAANVDASEGDIALRETIRLRVDAGERSIRLWVYADRVAVAPAALDDVSWPWIYPGERDYGRASVEDVRVDGRAVTARWVRAPVGTARGRDAAGGDLVITLAPSDAPRELTVTLAARVHVPRRFGRLGRDGDVLSLVGPWYPLVVGAQDATRFRVAHVVHLAGVGSTRLFAGGRELGAGGTVRLDGAYVPVLAAERFFVRDVRADGTRVRLVSAHPLYTPAREHAPGLEGLEDIVRIDVAGRVALVTRRVLATLRTLDARLVPRDLVLLMTPSHVELAATAPGVVLVSERVYEIFPIDLVRDFQDRALGRALYGALLESLVDRVEPAADRAWSNDLRAVLFADLQEIRFHGRARTPEELLGFAAFHPTVDQLLYAPQVPFQDVYFGSIDETDAFRDDPARARRPRAGGRRMLEAARDALGPARMRAFTAELAAGRLGARAALERVAPELGSRVDQWLDTPILPVNYRLGRIRSTRDRRGWAHDVEVFRDGARRIEPVEIEVEDVDGHVARGSWDGEGTSGHVVIRTPAERDDVRIDPRGRLPQSADVADGNPRADDATSAPWKPPLLQAFGLALALSEGRVDGLLDFAMRRRYDLERSLAARIDSSAAGQELWLRYVLGIGPKLDNNARIGFLSLGAAGDRFRAGYTEGGQGGWGGALTVSGGWDTRRYKIDPRHGSSFVGALRLGGVGRDDGSFGVTLAGTVRASLLVPWGLRNVTALFAGAGYTVGPGLPAQQQGLAGPFLLRGFEAGELVGDGRVYAIAEHRFNLVTDLAWNVLHIGWVREIELAAWVAGGVLFGERATGDVRFAGEVGGGLRLLFEWLGVQPAALSVDFAVPVTRQTRAVVAADGSVRQRSPFGLYIAFDQIF